MGSVILLIREVRARACLINSYYSIFILYFINTFKKRNFMSFQNKYTIIHMKWGVV